MNTRPEYRIVWSDCREGKHRACDGRGFDLVADVIVRCVCECHADPESHDSGSER